MLLVVFVRVVITFVEVAVAIAELDLFARSIKPSTIVTKITSTCID